MFASSIIHSLQSLESLRPNSSRTSQLVRHTDRTAIQCDAYRKSTTLWQPYDVIQILWRHFVVGGGDKEGWCVYHIHELISKTGLDLTVFFFFINGELSSLVCIEQLLTHARTWALMKLACSGNRRISHHFVSDVGWKSRSRLIAYLT
jgi:hypothetical protein